MSRKKQTILIPNKLVEGWENVEKAIDENGTMLSERSFTLAAGGLALSFTVMSFIVGEDKTALDWQAPVIWSLYLLCILLDTLSIIFAKRTAEKLEKELRKKVNRNETMSESEMNKLIDKTNRPIKLFNALVFVFLLGTIIWTFVYSYSLLRSLS